MSAGSLMDPLSSLLEVCAVIAGSSGVIFSSWYRNSRARINRTLAKLPRTATSDLTENQLVRVVGHVKNLEHSVVSPITGTHCVYWNVTVELGKGSGWQTIVTESNGTPFLLADDAGHAIVDPRAATITTKHLRYLPQLRPDPYLDRFLIRHQLINRKAMVRIREMLIEVGETFTIMGVGVGDRDPLAEQPDGYRAEGAVCFRFVGSKRHPLVISDDPSLR